MKKLKYLFLLLIIFTLGSCSTTARIAQIDKPEVYRDLKIQKKNLKIFEDYTLITSKRGARHMIYHHIYTLEIIN